MADVGLTFSPTSDQSNAQQRTPGGGGLSPVQDAIRILSFKLPTVLGPGAITPGSNLGQPYGLGDSVIQEWLRQLMMGVGGASGSPYGGAYGGDGTSGGGAPRSPLPPSVIVSQPRPSPPPDTTPPPSPGPPPNPFPGSDAGRGGRPY